MEKPPEEPGPETWNDPDNPLTDDMTLPRRTIVWRRGSFDSARNQPLLSYPLCCSLTGQSSMSLLVARRVLHFVSIFLE